MQITGSSESSWASVVDSSLTKQLRAPSLRREASSVANVGKTRYPHRRVKLTYKTQLKVQLKVDPRVKMHDLKLQNFRKKIQRGIFWTWV